MDGFRPWVPLSTFCWYIYCRTHHIKLWVACMCDTGLYRLSYNWKFQYFCIEECACHVFIHIFIARWLLLHCCSSPVSLQFWINVMTSCYFMGHHTQMWSFITLILMFMLLYFIFIKYISCARRHARMRKLKSSRKIFLKVAINYNLRGCLVVNKLNKTANSTTIPTAA